MNDQNIYAAQNATKARPSIMQMLEELHKQQQDLSDRLDVIDARLQPLCIQTALRDAEPRGQATLEMPHSKTGEMIEVAIRQARIMCARLANMQANLEL